jgi:dUTP pyrophosphatase
MKIKVKFANDEVKELYLKSSDNKSIFPFKTYDNDFCYDVVATSCEEVAPNVYKYGIGLAFQIERDWECLECSFGDGWLAKILGDSYWLELRHSPLKLSIDLRPRSSIWKTGMMLANSQGTIDEGYTNEISAVFYHIMPNMPKYEVGDRIGQIKIGATFPIEFIEVDSLDSTERGEGGFGSTGK